jgi:hypothetical protein
MRSVDLRVPAIMIGAALMLCAVIAAGRCFLFFNYASALASLSKGEYSKALPIVYGNALFDDSGACGVLGTMYLLGHGVTKDGRRAEYWLRKAAMGGSVASQFVLGAMYARGTDVPRNVGKAQVWLSKAAAEGDTQAGAALRGLKRGTRI